MIYRGTGSVGSGSLVEWLDPTNVDITGGTIVGVTIDNSVIGGTTPAAGTFTTLTATSSITGTLATAAQPNITSLGTIASLVATTADINGGTFDGVVGGTTPAAGTFTTLNATGGGALTGTWTDLGSVTTIDINGGTIDGATIATSDITVGAAKTLDVSAGTLTLADNQISGNKIDGGTISSFASTGIDDNASSNAITIDASQRVGIGVDPSGDWGLANYSTLLLGGTAAWIAEKAEGASNAFHMLQNAYHDGTGYKRITAAKASRYYQNAGNHAFQYAATDAADSTVSWLTAFTTSDNHVILQSHNDATTPTLAFGDGNTGLYEASDNDLRIAIAGTSTWYFSSTLMGSVSGSGARLEYTTSSSTNPTLIPYGSDTDTGIGGSGSDHLYFISGGTNAFQMGTTYLQGPTTGSATIWNDASSSTNPAFSFTGDADTGMGRAGADALSLITGGTEAIRIDSSQNIILDNTTTYADAKLHVGSVSDTAANKIAFHPGTATNSAGIFNGAFHAHTIIGSYLSTYQKSFISNGYPSDGGRTFSIGRATSSNYATATYEPLLTVDSNTGNVEVINNLGVGVTYTGGLGSTGVQAAAAGFLTAVRDSGTPFYVNRLTNDGGLVEFYQAGTAEGSISVSGTTVSYNAFCGGHNSQLQDLSTPAIPKGTVMESIDEMCEWYVEAVEYIDYEDDEERETVFRIEYEPRKKEDIINPETVPVRKRDGVLGQAGIISRKDNDQLGKVKISDTAGSARVYGVFSNYLEDDLNVHSLGASVVRVKGPIAGGALLESAGDGTARAQADDIIRSSTIGKVTVGDTTVAAGVEHLVPCVLYCG